MGRRHTQPVRAAPGHLPEANALTFIAREDAIRAWLSNGCPIPWEWRRN